MTHEEITDGLRRVTEMSCFLRYALQHPERFTAEEIKRHADDGEVMVMTVLGTTIPVKRREPKHETE